jgi:Subtilase family/Bacterial Ig domain
MLYKFKRLTRYLESPNLDLNNTIFMKCKVDYERNNLFIGKIITAGLVLSSLGFGVIGLQTEAVSLGDDQLTESLQATKEASTQTTELPKDSTLLGENEVSVIDDNAIKPAENETVTEKKDNDKIASQEDSNGELPSNITEVEQENTLEGEKTADEDKSIPIKSEADSQVQNMAENNIEDFGDAVLPGTVLIEYQNEQEMINTQQVIADYLKKDIKDIAEMSTEVKPKTALINLDKGTDTVGLIREVKSEEVITNIQPIYNYKPFYAPTNDPLWTQQWYSQNTVAGTNTETGWDRIGASKGVACTSSPRCGGETSVKIAVIDTGVNTTAQDMVGNIDTGNSLRFFNQGDNTCPATTYYVGFPSGNPSGPAVYNFCRTLGSQFDEAGHGTGVSSIISAKDNTIGTVGVAYNTTLLPIALHGDALNTYFVAEAINHAVASGAKVINMSLGSPFSDPYLETAINNAVNQGVIVIAASGNCAVWSSSCDWDGNGVQTPNYFAEVNNALMYPSGFANVIAVGASDKSTTAAGITRSNYSNYGSHIAVVAPVGDTSATEGVQVLCGTVRTGCATVDTYRQGFGTSYAAPQVAGIAGLVLSIDPTINSTKFRQLLQTTSTDLGTAGKDNDFGYGLVNTERLLGAATLEVAFTGTPSNNFVHFNNTNLTLNASASDTVGSITQVQLYRDTTLIGTDTTAPYSFNMLANTLTVGQIGQYVLKATSSTGTTKDSLPITIAIKSSTNRNQKDDINGDSKSDSLWLSGYTGEVIYRNNNNSTSLGGVGTEWKYVDKGDMDNNGKADIVWIHRNSNVVVLWPDSSPAGAVVLGTQIANYKYLGMDDFDGDGINDLLWQNTASRKISYWKSGYASNDTLLGFINPGWTYLGKTDLDANGKGDIVWIHDTLYAVHYWRDGLSTYGTELGYQTSDWRFVGLSDVDGNGARDIIWYNTGTLNVTYWRSGLQAQAAFLGTVNYDWTYMGSGDIDLNGKQDMIWQHNTLRELHYWPNSLASMGTRAGAIPPNYFFNDLGDYDGNGKIDIMIRGNGNRGITTWMDSTQTNTSPSVVYPTPSPEQWYYLK